MKLKFKIQGFQEAATAAVCDVFEGQPYNDPQCVYGRSRLEAGGFLTQRRRVFWGWIVPGIAIREGVKKSLDIMADKFQGDYGKVAKTFVVIVGFGSENYGKIYEIF